MLLRMKTTLAGPEFAVQAGDTWECPDDKFARQLIDDGNAEQVEAEIVEMVSTFHGGLKAADRPLDELTGEVTPNPAMSTAREAAEVAFPLDRRTADELAADAKLDEHGAVIARDPGPAKSSNQRAREEAESKVAAARAAQAEPKAAADEKKLGFRSPRPAGSKQAELPKVEAKPGEPAKAPEKK